MGHELCVWIVAARIVGTAAKGRRAGHGVRVRERARPLATGFQPGGLHTAGTDPINFAHASSCITPGRPGWGGHFDVWHIAVGGAAHRKGRVCFRVLPSISPAPLPLEGSIALFPGALTKSTSLAAHWWHNPAPEPAAEARKAAEISRCPPPPPTAQHGGREGSSSSPLLFAPAWRSLPLCAHLPDARGLYFMDPDLERY